MTRAKDISKIVTDADLSGTLDVAGDLTVDTSTLKVDSTNNRVGVGTSSPSYKLDVDVTGSALRLNSTTSQALLVISSDDSANAKIEFGDESDNDRGAITYDNPNNAMLFQTNTSERMRIDSSGNVGIGTSSPSQALTVASSGSGARISLTDTDSIATAMTGLIEFDGSDTRAGFIGYNSGNLTLRTDSTDSIIFSTNDTEAARIDSSGNLLVGKTSPNVASVGFEAKSDGAHFMTRDGGEPLKINRKTSDGNLVAFAKDGSIVGVISTASSYLAIGDDCGILFNNANPSFTPFNALNRTNVDNSVDLGASNARFDDIYATNSTIQTSDRNEKQDIEELSEAEKRVAVVAKGLMRKFRWIDSVAEKGDNARTHFGIIAQDLQDAFTAEGLDANKYAMFTSNTWWEKEISVDAVEADEENGIEAKDAYIYMDNKDEATDGYTEKTRLGVRYNQLLAFIISAI